MTDVKRDDPYRVPSNQEALLLCIPQDKRENAVQALQASDAIPIQERDDDFAIGIGLERVVWKFAAQLPMIVDLPIHSQHIAFAGAVEWLRPVQQVYDSQAFVRKDGMIIGMDT